jgi:sulfoxide reductase catalytic subunit YedY
MSNIILRPGWQLPERRVTPEPVFLNRRHFLRQMGFAGGGLMALSNGELPGQEGKDSATEVRTSTTFPAPRHPLFNPRWKLSDEKIAATYNNFYEFSTSKDRVHQLTGAFVTSPWPVEIRGLVENPMKIDAGELASMFGLEERVYRFRCVEAWSMIVPWTGFPLRKLLEKVKPKSEARFVRFETFNRPNQAPGMAQLRGYPWPYTEGLRLDEAMNPLVIVATGIYGKPLPKQHGAPLRMVVPWKYGYKSIKSIVKIDLVASQPSTLWETLSPDEYPFESNVNPGVPHPRWSQATERMIDTDERVKTLIYNGYGSYVADLYSRGAKPRA